MRQRKFLVSKHCNWILIRKTSTRLLTNNIKPMPKFEQQTKKFNLDPYCKLNQPICSNKLNHKFQVTKFIYLKPKPKFFDTHKTQIHDNIKNNIHKHTCIYIKKKIKPWGEKQQESL